ncbi:hypothetical protein J6590_080978 [Homalodisca vitripennis]|nr:hypothetical protein J6590_080978 [Homalodisca vitripennis]
MAGQAAACRGTHAKCRVTQLSCDKRRTRYTAPSAYTVCSSAANVSSAATLADPTTADHSAPADSNVCHMHVCQSLTLNYHIQSAAVPLTLVLQQLWLIQQLLIIQHKQSAVDLTCPVAHLRFIIIFKSDGEGVELSGDGRQGADGNTASPTLS